MKRIIIIAAAVAAVLAGGLSVPANAASSARSTPSCVTKAEYKKVHRSHTMAQVKRTFGTNGRLSSVEDNSYWLWGDYIDDGYWTGDYVFDGESWVWDDYAGEYIDNSYYTGDEYVSMLDSNRDYKKCRSWNHGRGRVAINFDNYSSARSGYRVYSKWPNRPWFWNAFGLRTSDASVLGDKQIETGHEHASGHRTKADADRAEAKAKAAAKADRPS